MLKKIRINADVAHIWRFPKMWVPLFIIHLFNRVFHDKSSSYWGSPILGNPPLDLFRRFYQQPHSSGDGLSKWLVFVSAVLVVVEVPPQDGLGNTRQNRGKPAV